MGELCRLLSPFVRVRFIFIKLAFIFARTSTTSMRYKPIVARLFLYQSAVDGVFDITSIPNLTLVLIKHATKRNIHLTRNFVAYLSSWSRRTSRPSTTLLGDAVSEGVASSTIDLSTTSSPDDLLFGNQKNAS